MKKLIAAILLGILPVTAALAQTEANAAPAQLATVSGTATDASSSNSLVALGQWLATQQAQVGTAFGFDKTPSGKPVEYATTYWDAVSLGSKGLNVGLASAKDLLDFSIGLSAANQRQTRYGIFIPVHVGNMWNSISFPAAIAEHVHMATLPNCTVALALYEPKNGQLDKWTIKDDGQLSVAYRFGGSSN